MEHILAGESLSVTVRPDLGGRIDRVTDIRTGKEWLWHPAWYRGGPRRLDVGAPFDENWSGGWDEIFPNDAGGEFRGRSLPDHGELWSQGWRVAGETASGLKMAYSCSTVPVACEKEVTVTEGGLRVRYLLENRSRERLPFLFKLHAALAIEPGNTVLLPRCVIEPVDTGFSTIIGRTGRTAFPYALRPDGGRVRLDRVPGPEAAKREFFYATDLAGPWCGLKDGRTGTTLTFAFDSARIPYVWVFASYGGWNGHYVLVLEPSTNMPYDLETALAKGTCAVLEPEERREMTVTVTIRERAAGVETAFRRTRARKGDGASPASF